MGTNSCRLFSQLLLISEEFVISSKDVSKKKKFFDVSDVVVHIVYCVESKASKSAYNLNFSYKFDVVNILLNANTCVSKP